ncbi:MAG: glycosyltransferase family 4 protein [Anaerolineae bacterium]|nr:glycosyltransferase family 4 protein [Anaerolineae bacterium]
MRIGIDARLTHYRQAGISRYTVQLIDALSRLETPPGEAEDEFVILQSFRAPEPLLDAPRFTRRRIFTPSHHRLEQLILPIEISSLGLDVLHSPDFIPPFRRNCRSVITIHDLVFLLYPHFLTKDAARYYGQIDQAVRRADAIIAVSEATKRDTMRLLGVSERKISVIYEAASPFFRPLEDDSLLARVQARFQIRGDYVLFVSTIEPRKNVAGLLRAFRRLLDAYHPDVQLVVAGEKGWLYDDVFQLASDLHLLDDVLFVGRVSTEELLWLYNAAQLLVAPSIYEGFGLTPLEAMACGTPVVASNVSALPEVVGDAGLLVDPKDPEEMSVAIWRVLDDAEMRASLIEKGLRRAAVFSWDKAAQETLELYHSLA